jgi:putative phosphoesterase
MHKLLILSDIHANLTALNAVLNDSVKYKPYKAVLLGDIVDYGMRPNEVIDALQNLNCKILVNIWGNHEKAIFDKELSKFSSDRTRDFSRFTSKILTDESRQYLLGMRKEGFAELSLEGKQILAIHGSLEDVFWKGISVENITTDYSKYDYVLFGHTHVPMYFERRGENKTVFINPGSVGQPRNNNPRACYSVLDLKSGAVFLENAKYDVKLEQELYTAEIDEFYKTRLAVGK